MIITRDVINKNITFLDYDLSDNIIEYSYDDISRKVNLYKNYLVSIGCEKGESVLIGYGPGIDQIALFLAICELGLIVIVNDYRTLNNNKFDFIDSKTKILSPIDYFFDYNGVKGEKRELELSFKREFFKKICNNYITIEEVIEFGNYNSNDLVWANSDDILMKCTSSGTTGTPKKVQHTHEFLYNISYRNTQFFDGSIALLFNFNHGSSLATYFIPAMMSPKTAKFCNISRELLDGKNKEIRSDCDKVRFMFKDIDHVMLPYADDLDRMVEIYAFPNITYYTLSPLIEDLLIAQKRKHCKNIISFFGCNETSGPIFINSTKFSDFKTSAYYLIDDYYKIKSFNPLTVYLKEYDNDIDTKDIFEKVDDRFIFKGRNDLIRINGLPISKDYSSYLNDIDPRADFIYDTVYGKIYLAIWSRDKNQQVENTINSINNKLVNVSNGKHEIYKVDFLVRSDFVSGVKLDHELCREYFRNKVSKYAKI